MVPLPPRSPCLSCETFCYLLGMAGPPLLEGLTQTVEQNMYQSVSAFAHLVDATCQAIHNEDFTRGFIILITLPHQI
jgi:hypothetical protein